MAKRSHRHPGAKPAEKDSPESPTKAQKTPREIAASAQTSGSDLEQQALYHLSELLRLWGKNAFDVEGIDAFTIGMQMERWAQHVLMEPEAQENKRTADADGKTRSASAAAGQNQKPQSATPAHSPQQREWDDLHAFTTEIRQREKTHVRRQLASIRKMIGQFVQTIGSVVSDHQSDQAQITSVIAKLQDILDGEVTVEEIRSEVKNAMQVITTISQERAQHQKSKFQDLTLELKIMLDKIDSAHREVELDTLTRLLSRKAFDEQIERVFELSRLIRQDAALLMLDIDQFHVINETYGQPIGDQVLRYLANCCVKLFPRKGDFVARYGGDEIAIVLQNTDGDAAMEMGERLLNAVRIMGVPHDSEGMIGVTVSIGIAIMNPKGTSMRWINAANRALAFAKERGHDCIVQARRV